MHKKFSLFSLLLASLLTSCISVSTPIEPTGTPLFVTSTLPPTKQLVSLPSHTPAQATGTAGAPTLDITAPPNCKDQAVLLEDVTIPDDTQMKAGESFTKTWKLKNTGTCPWTGYTLVFADGDRMDAPDSAPVPQTVSGADADVSVELVAPVADGAYTGNFSLHNADGETVNIGIEETMWVKIRVGAGSISSTPGASSTQSSSSGGSSSVANCKPTQNSSYVSQILSLINAARADAGMTFVAPFPTSMLVICSVDGSNQSVPASTGADVSASNTWINR